MERIHRTMLFVLLMLTAVFSSCRENASADLLTSGNEIKLTSPDTFLVSIFNWARKTSDGYVGRDSDPVGPWYEAALPGREAFCIRDVSHQCIGTVILGHSRQNLNMFRKFVENISEQKDFCSYWEINRYNKPAPVDYKSDNDFWYNLNANFDIIDACYKLYQWTGDTTYIYNKSFDAFFKQTLNQFIDRWQLQPDRIMKRPAMMNLKPGTVKYRNARGIPSYDESQDGITLSSDLLGMICNAYRKYSEILRIKGLDSVSKEYLAISDQYMNLIDSLWWDDDHKGYHGFFLSNGRFSEGGISNSEFLLWYGIISDPGRIEKSLGDLRNSQVEVLSYMPALFYRYGKNDEGYDYLKRIYADKRRMYPEASSAAIEGIVKGMLGVNPVASDGIVITCPHLSETVKWVQAENIPVFSGIISLHHYSNAMTSFANKSGRQVIWRATFTGEFESIMLDRKLIYAQHKKDSMGRICTFVDISVKPGEQINAMAVKKL